MLQKIQGYDFTIEYRQGKTMTMADTLSRLPNPKDKGAVELDLRVDGIEMTRAEVHRCDIDLVNFSQRKQHQLRDQTARDRPRRRSWKPSSKDGLTASRICQLMYEFSGHSVMSWLLKTASFSKSSSQRVCEQTFLPNSINLTRALRRPNYWPEKVCTGQTKTLNK